jgi:PqqD family protein of HPr-rel-A system
LHHLVQPVLPLHAVFDRLSGRTHMITDVAYAVYLAAAEPGTAAEISTRVLQVADVQVESGDDIEAALHARIEELLQLELLTLVS